MSFYITCKIEGITKEMGFSEFWINNNGKKEHLNNAKHGVRREQMDEEFHNLFDAYDINGDGTLENEELDRIYKGLTKHAGSDKTLDASENRQVTSLFENQYGIQDADFMGFVRSVSNAAEDIIDSKITTSPDGGKEITTTYKDGSVLVISYYPDGDYKFKKFDQKTTIEAIDYVINENYDKKYTKDELENLIKKEYNKYVTQIKQRTQQQKKLETNKSIEFIPDYEMFRQQWMAQNNVESFDASSHTEYHVFELSERAENDVEVRDFILNHYIETHLAAKEALESMGILDNIGAAINAGAGELWNSIKNVWNGTEEEYQNFYELSKKFKPNYDKAMETVDSLGEMRNKPEMFFRDFETDFENTTGHKFDFQAASEFQEATEQYQNAQILKQRIDILNKAMQQIDDYEKNQAGADSSIHTFGYMSNVTSTQNIETAYNLLLQYFDNNQETVDMLLQGVYDDPQLIIKTIKGIKEDTEKLYTTVLDGKTFDQIQEDYKSQYKEMYGTDFVPDELTDKVIDAKATGGMVKLAIITIISILVTRSPIMAEISAAAGGAEVSGATANMIRTLVARYGQAAVQQGIKFAMTSGTLATDVGLTLLNQVTSERGVDGEELWESTKSSAKYIFFGAYIGGPLAQAVSKTLGKTGATAKLFEGGTKSAEGAIVTTEITGDKLLQNFIKGGNTALAKSGAFLTEVGAFAGLEITTEGANIKDAFSEQGGMLSRLKLMNYLLEYLLGARTHTATSKARLNAAIEKSGVKNWTIKEVKNPQKTYYIVEVDGLPPRRFEDANQLATAMLERVTANYDENANSNETTTESNDAKIKKQIEDYVNRQYKSRTELEKMRIYYEIEKRLIDMEQSVGDKSYLSFAKQTSQVERCIEHVTSIDGFTISDGINGMHSYEALGELAEIIKNPIEKNVIKISEKFKTAMKNKKSLQEYDIDNIRVVDFKDNCVTLQLSEDTQGILSLKDNTLTIIKNNETTKTVEFQEQELKSFKNILNDIPGEVNKFLKNYLKSPMDITEASVSTENGNEVIIIKFNTDDHGFKVPHTFKIEKVKTNGTMTEYKQSIDDEVIGPKSTVPQEDLNIVMNSVKESAENNRLATLKIPPETCDKPFSYTLKYKGNYYVICCPEGELATVFPVTNKFLIDHGVELSKVPELK